MAVRTQEELLTSIRGLLPDDTSDEAISLLEDLTDTLGSFSNTNNDNEDWKKKYEENDKEWRQKYRDRFFNTGSNDGKVDAKFEPEPEPEPTIKKFDDLFNTKE